MARFLKNRLLKKGKAPGSLIHVGNKKMDKCRIRIIQYNKEEINEYEIENINDVNSFLNRKYTTWINIDGLHDIELIKQAGKIFSVSALALEDILNTDQRPKFHEDISSIIIILKALYCKDNGNILSSEQISFIIKENCLITFQERVGDHFEMVRERLRQSIGKLREEGPDYLCYSLIDAIVDSYIITIEELGTVIENLEEKIMQADKNIINNIYKHKTEIAYIRKVVRPVKELMTYFIKTESQYINRKILIYLNDLDELVTQTLEAIEIYYTMITDQLNIYHTNVSNRVNDVMKVLTIFASIFIPLTFIAGIYGTNFDNIPELHFKYGYYAMWGVILIVAVIMLIFFKRKKWL